MPFEYTGVRHMRARLPAVEELCNSPFPLSGPEAHIVSPLIDLRC